MSNTKKGKQKASRVFGEVNARTSIGGEFFNLNPQPTCDPNCPDCKGNGIFSIEVHVGHPLFGKSFVCQNLPVDHKNFSYSNIPLNERGISWADVKKRENVEDGYHAIQRVMRLGSGVVYLYGGNGLAKTLMLKIAVMDYLRSIKDMSVQDYLLNYHDKQAIYVHMDSIIASLQGTFGEKESGKKMSSIIDGYTSTPLLSIEEFGMGDSGEWAETKQFMVFDARYTAAIERGEKLITIIASNLTPDELPMRVRDRVTDGAVHAIPLSGESFRLSRKKKE